MKRLRLAGLAFCGLMLGGAVWAQEHAPTKAEAEVISLLEAKAAGAGVKLALVDHATLGALKAEGFERIFLTINPKKAYVVIGVCEETCTNLDITVYDGDEQVVGSDFETDANPVVFLEGGVNKTGKLKLFMSMKLCSVAPCVYGVGLYEVVGAKH